MKKLLSIAVSLAMLAGLVACGGGGGGSTSTGGTYYTHAQLAAEFVRRVNSDVAGYDLELVKTNTLQYNYIVVYDYVTDSYDAYDIGSYNVGENLYNYLSKYDYYFYFGLTYIGNNIYEDPYTGTRFNREELSKNSELILAMSENNKKMRIVQTVQAEYGLSQSKAESVASAYLALENLPQGQRSVQIVDEIAKQTIGSTYSEIIADVQANNMVSLAQRFQTASEVTGLGVEQLNANMQKLFGSN